MLWKLARKKVYRRRNGGASVFQNNFFFVGLNGDIKARFSNFSARTRPLNKQTKKRWTRSYLCVWYVYKKKVIMFSPRSIRRVDPLSCALNTDEDEEKIKGIWSGEKSRSARENCSYGVQLSSSSLIAFSVFFHFFRCSVLCRVVYANGCYNRHHQYK